MKKIISFIIISAFALTMCNFNVFAKPYAAYPWVYEDFEKDETINCTPSNASIKRIAGGAGDTKGAARVDVSSTFGTIKFPISVKTGTTYNASVWVKMADTLPTVDKNLHFIFYTYEKLADGTPAESAKCYNDIVVSNVALSTSDYVQVKTTFTYAGTGRLNGQTVATCDGDATVELRLNGGTPINYYIDDLIVEPSMSEDNADPAAATFANGDFEPSYDESVWTKQNCTVTNVAGANGTSNGVMVTSIGNYGQIKQRAPIEFNKTYKISLYAKAGDSATVGKELKMVIDRKEGKTDTNITTNYEFLPSVALASDPARLVLTSDWQKIEFTYRSNMITYETNKPYIYPRVGTGTAQECYCLDEWKIEEVPDIVYNGDFSDALKGWKADNATAAVSTDVPSGSGYTTSAKISETADNGALKQGINVTQGKTYTISFYAKCDNATEIYPVLDRYTADSTDDVKYEYLTQNGTPAVVTPEWQKFDFTYTCSIVTDKYRVPQFYLKTGDGTQRNTYYITGIVITLNGGGGEETYKDPTIKNAALDGKNVETETGILTYEYYGPAGKTGLVKIMRSFNGSYVSVGSAELDGTAAEYTYTAADVGQTIKFIMIPLDAEGNIYSLKTAETKAILKLLDITPTFTSDFTGEKVTAEVGMTNNNAAAVTAVAMLALYDADNALISLTDTTAAAGTGETKKLTLATANNSKAAKAKLFVWSGTSALDTDMGSLIAYTQLSK